MSRKRRDLPVREEQLTARERQDLFELRCEEVLFNHEAPARLPPSSKQSAAKFPGPLLWHRL